MSRLTTPPRAWRSVEVDVGSLAPRCLFRPIVRLSDDEVDAHECVWPEENPDRSSEPFSPSVGESDWRRRLDFLIAELGAYPCTRLITRISADDLCSAAFPIDLIGSIARLSGLGSQIGFLLDFDRFSRQPPGLNDRLEMLKKAGCLIGLDRLGFAGVPMLWPFAWRFDMVRIDPRAFGLIAAGSIDASVLRQMIAFVASAGVNEIVADGCDTPATVMLAAKCGATHGQGEQLGSPSHWRRWRF